MSKERFSNYLIFIAKKCLKCKNYSNDYIDHYCCGEIITAAIIKKCKENFEVEKVEEK